MALDEQKEEKSRDELQKELNQINLEKKIFDEADARYSDAWVEAVFRYVLISIATAIVGLIIVNYIISYIHSPLTVTTTEEQPK